MEAGPPVHHRLGIFGDLPVQIGDRLVPVHPDGVPGTDGDAPAAAHAPAVVDGGLAVRNGDAVVGADAGAGAAAHAVVLGHMGLPGVVLLHLTGPAAAAHADVLQRAAEARLLVALEMGQGDEHVRVHHRPADLGLLHIFAAAHRHLHLVVALEAVGDDDLAAGGQGGEPVEHGGVHVVQGVFPPAYIQGVAVGQEGLAAPLLHEVCHGLGPVGPQKGQVAGLAEVQLDGRELVLKVDLAHTGGFHQTGQLLGQIFPIVGPQVGPINFRCHLEILLESEMVIVYHIPTEFVTLF